VGRQSCKVPNDASSGGTLGHAVHAMCLMVCRSSKKGKVLEHLLSLRPLKLVSPSPFISFIFHRIGLVDVSATHLRKLQALHSDFLIVALYLTFH
jgi:hypothetical protein